MGTTTPQDSNLVRYAREELERAGLFDEDSDYGGMLGDATLRVVEAFASEGHSGFSASVCVGLLERLLRFEPLTPLTYAADEWNHIADDMAGDPPLWQNRRKSDVFSHDHEATWYCLDGASGVRGDTAAVPVDPEPAPPPSIADGTVAEGLVAALRALGDEYGPRGVARAAAELAG